MRRYPSLAILALGGAAAASFGLGGGTEWMPSALVVGAVLVGVVVPSVVASDAT